MSGALKSSLHTKPQGFDKVAEVTNIVNVQQAVHPTSVEPTRERVALETAEDLIEGTVQLPPHAYRNRFSDYLNRDDVRFISLVEVDRTRHGDGSRDQFSFLAVAVTAVRVAYPLDD